MTTTQQNAIESRVGNLMKTATILPQEKALEVARDFQLDTYSHWKFQGKVGRSNYLNPINLGPKSVLRT